MAGRVAYDPKTNPGSTAIACAKWITAEKGIKVTASQVRAVLSYYPEFARLPETAEAREQRRADKVTATLAKARKAKERAEAVITSFDQLGADIEVKAKPAAKKAPAKKVAPKTRAKAAPAPVDPEDPEEEAQEPATVTPIKRSRPAVRRRPKAKTAGRKVSF